MDNTTTQIAMTQISPIAALVAAMPVRTLVPASACAPWERSHASTLVGSTGGVRLLPVADGRLRDVTGAYGTSLFPSAGPSTSSPPV